MRRVREPAVLEPEIAPETVFPLPVGLSNVSVVKAISTFGTPDGIVVVLEPHRDETPPPPSSQM